MKLDESGMAASAGLLTFAVGACLVGLRGTLADEVIVLLFALCVVASGRWTGRAGAGLSALMAALSFDFFFTHPYLSLKMTNAEDIGVTIVLFVVGLVAGGLSAQAQRDHALAERQAVDVEAIRRLLEIAGSQSVEDVEMAVRAEMLRLLDLYDCDLVEDASDLPALGRTGALPQRRFVYRREGFELPERFAIDVVAAGQNFGALACSAIPGMGVSITRRRTAVAAAHILGLAMVASSANGKGSA